MTQFTINHNANFNSEEITFNGIPAAPIREALKNSGFRWHSVKKVWYGRKTPEEITAIITAADEQTESGESWRDIPGATNAPSGYKWQNNGKSRFSGEYKNRLVKADAPQPKKEKAAEAPKGTPQDRIKIYYNGLKINGGKLRKCFYIINGDSITICANDYGSEIPTDLFDVTNETDLYTDYFDTDRATVDPSHPLYKYLRFAALKDRATSDRRIIAKADKKLAEPLSPLSRKYYEDEKTAAAERLKDFEKATDPGQPTAEDLAKIDQQNTARENARKAAEQAKEQKYRERYAIIRCEGRRTIEAAKTAHPIEEGQPTVTLEWSEHPGIDDNTVLSVPAAEIVLKTLDERQHTDREIDPDTAPGYYFKTSFRIDYTDPESGEPCSYTGRYDLGDGDGGMIEHIRAFGEWNRTHDTLGHVKDTPDETNDILTFADTLRTYCERKEA